MPPPGIVTRRDAASRAKEAGGQESNAKHALQNRETAAGYVSGLRLTGFAFHVACFAFAGRAVSVAVRVTLRRTTNPGWGMSFLVVVNVALLLVALACLAASRR